MPNPLAYLMLMIWPVVCVTLFQRLSRERAIIWGILGAYLILPPVAEFDLPLVPSMNKDSVAAVGTFLACVLVARSPVSFWPKPWSVRLLLIAFVFGVFPTVLTNRDPLLFEVLENSDPIVFVTNFVPGLGIRDALSMMIGQVMVLLPFFLARTYLASEKGLRDILLALAIGGLVYSIPSMFEVIFAPILNINIYGFFQHDFRQMIRDGGFRPIVFLPHGLWLAFFMATAVFAAAALARASKDKTRMRWGGAMFFLLLVLNACKSMASLLYGVFLTPLILFASRRLQVRIALMIAAVAIAYPALRNLGMIPLDAILDFAGSISTDRAQSLAFRFDNEETLLDRAHYKPWFGWGGWGRNLVLDPETGLMISVPDGAWIIVFGTYGWLGYFAQMGLLAMPIALLHLHTRNSRSAELSYYVAPITIILAATMTDMLLNATLTPFTWLCAGAVLGHVEKLTSPAQAVKEQPLFGTGPVLGRKQDADDERTVL